MSVLAAYHLVCPIPASLSFRLPEWLSTFPSVTSTGPSTMR
jgi:hypothetical protein